MLLYSIFQFATIFLFLFELFLEFCYCIISFLHTEIKEETLSLSSKGTDASKLSVTRTAKLNVYGITKQLSPGIKTFYNVLFNILIKVGTNRVTNRCICSLQQTLPWVLFLKKCSSFSCCYQLYKFKLLWIYARKKFLSRAQWFYLPLETVPVSSFLTIRSFHSTNLDNHSLSIQSFHLSLVFKIITAASIRRYM